MMFSDEIRSKSWTDPPDDAAVGSGHRRRLRMRMEKAGWDALRPHEMLELTLFPALPRQDLSDVARALVDRFGSLDGVFDAPAEDLARVPGVSDALADWIGLTGTLLRAYRTAQAEDEPPLSCFAQVRRFLQGWHPDDETGMWALFLDIDFCLVTFERLGGANWWAPEGARRLASSAISAGARYVVFVRFAEDGMHMDEGELRHMCALSHTLSALDVDILDCVVAGGGACRSLNADGRMDDIRRRTGRPELYERYLRET